MTSSLTTSRNTSWSPSSTALLRRIAGITLAGGALLGLAGCRQDMQDQPKFYPQRGTTLYADGRSVRPQVQDTVARGQGDVTSYLVTGMQGGKEGDGLPVPLTLDLIARGQERYNIYCSACHSRVGNGGGIVVERGYLPAGNFHTDRLRKAPLGHFFNVITNGYGAMPDYASMLPVEDRWAVVAYIRALQLSQNATVADAGGNKVQSLGDVAEASGLPRNTVQQWVLPATAVFGTPNHEENGIPGQDAATNGANAPGKTGAATQNTANPAAGAAAGSTSSRTLNASPSASPATLNGPVSPITAHKN